MSKLENWSIVQDSSNPFLAPELRTVRLQGEVYDREGFENGTSVVTSSIQTLNITKGYAVTRNTIYELGEPKKDFVEWLNTNGHKLEDYEGRF